MASGTRLNGTLKAFIGRQALFFVATADETGFNVCMFRLLAQPTPFHF
jgi:hypothetical protein